MSDVHEQAPAGRGGALNARAIVERTLEFVEREGAAALSLRRLGRELGVDATAFYRHFRDKDGLVLACMDRVTELVYERVAPAVVDADWESTLRAVAQHSRGAAASYPAIYSLAFARTTGGPGEQQMVELLLTRLSSTGLDPATSVLCYRTFVDGVLGMCGTAAATDQLGAEREFHDATTWSRVYGSLPVDRYPAARAHATQLATLRDEEVFDAVVEALIAWVGSIIASTHSRSRGPVSAPPGSGKNGGGVLGPGAL